MANLLLAIVAGISQPTEAEVVQGVSTYYNDGVMRQVISNRGLSYADGVALNSCGDLGRNVWIQWASDGSIMGPLPVVDCAQKIHYAQRERQGRVVEVSARVAKERGFYGVGPVPVIVWFEKPTMRWN